MGVALETLHLLGVNGILCLLGIYREKRVCEELGRVFTNMVLGNQLIFGSVNSNKQHFEKGITDMKRIRCNYGNVLSRLLTQTLTPDDFRQTFKPGIEEIKMTVVFQE